MRAPFVFAGLALSAIGYGINISNAGIGAKYFGTFLIAIGGYASFPAVNAWYVVHARSRAGELIPTQGPKQHLGSLQACRRTCSLGHVR